MKLFEQLIQSISKEQIEQYYLIENHSQKECVDFFGVSQGMFNHILKYYGIHKDTASHSALIKKTKLERYGDENYNNREQAEQTCTEKYGVDNPFKDTKRVRDGCIRSFGSTHPMYNDDIKKKCIAHHNYGESIAKSFATYKQRTGYDNPAQNPEVQRKGIKTKIRNGVYDSPHESNLERRLYKILCRKFESVMTHYRDSRYSRDTGYEFECDFYIPSEDLFIELNAHASHNDHPFDPLADIQLYEKLSNSDKSWDKNVLATWTQRDVEKMHIAKQKKLNYIVLYPTNTIYHNKLFNDKKYANLISYLLKKLNNKH